MAGNRRPFSRERHPRFKTAFAVMSVAGFALGWAALSRGHDATSTAPGTVPATATPAATGSPTITAPAANGTTTPSPTPARRPRTSRGS